MCMVTATLLIKRDGGEMRLLNSSRTVCVCISLFLLLRMFTSFPTALALAMSRDGSSGGVIRMCVITEEGVERLFVPGDQLPRFWEGKEVLPTTFKTAFENVPVPMAVE